MVITVVIEVVKYLKKYLCNKINKINKKNTSGSRRVVSQAIAVAAAAAPMC